MIDSDHRRWSSRSSWGAWHFRRPEIEESLRGDSSGWPPGRNERKEKGTDTAVERRWVVQVVRTRRNWSWIHVGSTGSTFTTSASAWRSGPVCQYRSVSSTTVHSPHQRQNLLSSSSFSRRDDEQLYLLVLDPVIRGLKRDYACEGGRAREDYTSGGQDICV
jgi:hypothetical protein